DAAPAGVSIETRGDGDTLEVTGKGRIRTLSELLAAAEVDLDVWRVERWKANSWEAFARASSGELVTETLHQVTAHLRPTAATEEGRLKAVQAVVLEALRSAPPRPVSGP